MTTLYHQTGIPIPMTWCKTSYTHPCTPWCTVALACFLKNALVRKTLSGGWAGKGTMIPKDDETTAKKREQNANNCNSELVTRSFWSDTYQWLPANLAFQQDGHVKFTSYINNLHPDKYADIYKTIEKLVETSVPMWDQCLALMRAGGGAGDTVQVGRQGTRMPSPDHPE
jgi:hypothetical protein